MNGKRTAILAKVAMATTMVTLLLGAPARAQEDDRADDPEQQRSREHFALAVGVGLADVDSVAETYLTAALRIRAGGRERDESKEDHDWRGRPPASGGMKGYFEPEVGYWKASGKNGNGSDLLVGINLVGVVPVGTVDTFIGTGVAAHRLDASLLSTPTTPTSTSKQTKIGVNAQFGLDVYMTRSLSLFGTGRFDVVQDARRSIQAKVYLGLRGRF